MILIFAFAGRVNSRHIGGLVLSIYPHAAHGVVHGGKNLHGFYARIDAQKLFVNFQDAFEFAIQRLARDVRHVEIYGGLSVQAEAFLIDDAMNGARGDVARDEIAVFRIPLFEKIKTLAFGNGSRRALIVGISWNPHAAAFASRRFAHQAEFVFAGNCGGMDLNEFAVRVVNALLKKSGLRGAGADDGIGGASKNRADSAGGKNHRVGGVRSHFHGAQIHGADTAAHAGFIDHRGKKCRAFEFFNFAFGFVAADLFIESVKQLLPGGGAGKRGAVI